MGTLEEPPTNIETNVIYHSASLVQRILECQFVLMWMRSLSSSEYITEAIKESFAVMFCARSEQTRPKAG